MGNLLRKFKHLPLAFGAAGLSGEGGGYGFGDITTEDALRLVKEAYDHGFRVFDTAPIYGFGLSEERLGLALKGKEDAFIVSKSGVSWHDNKRVNMTNNKQETEKMLGESLKRLKRDVIDLYMIHWPDQNVDIREPMEVLSRAKEKGKIKHIGLCNTNTTDLEAALSVDKIEVVQSQHNFFIRQELQGLAPLLKQHEISFMGWGTLDKGILSGSVYPGRSYDASDARSWAPWWKSQDNVTRFKIVDELKSLLEGSQLSLLDFAIHFSANSEGMTMPLLGYKNVLQMNNSLNALNKKFDTEFIVKANEIYQRLWPLSSTQPK
jgi:myo-inositol catabolism protein IolS